MFARPHAASRLSAAVPGRIVTAERAGIRVHSVFRSAVNLVTDDGLVTLASPGVGGLPNGVSVDLGPDIRSLGLRPGMLVEVDATELRVPAARLSVDWRGAPLWSPRLAAAAGSRAGAAARWDRRARAVWAAAADVAAVDGFGPLLRERGRGAARDGASRRARLALIDLAFAVATVDRSGAAVAAGRLIGLGPGLTPSGDDALAGIEAALRALDAPAAGFSDAALVGIEGQTTAVSATLLRHAAAGEFTERLHDLLGALLGPDDGALRSAIAHAVAWGATSGSDCLLGVLVGLDAGTGHRSRLA